ncbi:hypothetical protein CIPAW_13G083000 [Carya illinoinensis]|uniref:NB-ARC domain-containing protein n=1 Tax=Carya illinoinensis TaxID=32201 RepID=A0A8T1NLU5_CARIL|nr:hypothetical protein CIPAW_13G083000 [Carya illinoinensis]
MKIRLAPVWEKDKEAILELLLSEKSSDTKVSVIPILGMGGIGKTTLTQHVYNDEKVQLFFDLKAGVCVSDYFDVVRDDLNLLQVKLKENLKGKKFLVILDDIWNENYHDWTILRAPFQAGGPGSAIIITTRNQGVSSMIGTTQAYRLQVLSNDACLSLFTTHALQTEDFSMHANLKDIGEEIVRRCKGLPLADYEFEEKQLVWLWMAEGLIQLQEGEKQMEELGSQYFHNLVSRSFFQQSSENKSRFLMHDLINDLAQSIAGDTCFKMEDGSEGSNKGKISKKARHSSYVVSSFDGTKKFEVFYQPNMLTCRYLTCTVPLQLLPKLQYLRVLSLSSYYITELPDSIGNLKHLHYIDLSHTLIKSLPESMTTLYNLQTLLLENCPIEKLPSTFANLLNLHHLNILNADLLEGMPPQIGKLTSLQTLSNMFVGKGTCSKVKELGPLSHLEGMLCILRLENVVESKDASDANLIGKPNLSGLMFEWCSNIIEPQDDESQHKLIELEVLDVLQPHHTLKELTIKCYGGVEFPTWLRRPSFPNMVLFPTFISLETLYFDDMWAWENWISYGDFPQLRQLYIQNCPKLLGKLPNHLPLLEKVVINGCWNLVVTISSFPQVCQLEIEQSKGVICRSKIHFSSLSFKCLSTISEFTRQIEGLTMEGLTSVEDLTIDGCEELMPLWSNDAGLKRPLPCLHVLNISNCPKLVSFVAEDVGEQLQLGFRSTFKEIKISNCIVLRSLPKTVMYNSTCLEYILIDRCDSVKYFAIGQLPPTLKQLEIQHCKNMLILLDDGDTNCLSSSTSLVDLTIIGCPSLKSLTSSGELPATLKYLHIWSCQKLESIAKRFHHNSFLEYVGISRCENLKSLPTGIHSLSHLDQIYLAKCPALDFFPDVGLLPANLRVLQIFDCEKMQALPNSIYNLASLKLLKISECPSIVSVPKEGFPTNLTSLYLSDLNINEALFEWGLHKLTSQKCLNINGFRILTPLKELLILECEKLSSFPKDGLPPSLLQLYVNGCPSLKERCKKDQGQDWSKIARIPCVWLDGKFIYDP